MNAAEALGLVLNRYDAGDTSRDEPTDEALRVLYELHEVLREADLHRQTLFVTMHGQRPYRFLGRSRSVTDAGETYGAVTGGNGRYVLPCGCVPPCEGHHEDES